MDKQKKQHGIKNYAGVKDVENSAFEVNFNEQFPSRTASDSGGLANAYEKGYNKADNSQNSGSARRYTSDANAEQLPREKNTIVEGGYIKGVRYEQTDEAVKAKLDHRRNFQQ